MKTFQYIGNDLEFAISEMVDMAVKAKPQEVPFDRRYLISISHGVDQVTTGELGFKTQEADILFFNQLLSCCPECLPSGVYFFRNLGPNTTLFLQLILEVMNRTLGDDVPYMSTPILLAIAKLSVFREEDGV